MITAINGSNQQSDTGKYTKTFLPKTSSAAPKTQTFDSLSITTRARLVDMQNPQTDIPKSSPSAEKITPNSNPPRISILA